MDEALEIVRWRLEEEQRELPKLILRTAQGDGDTAEMCCRSRILLLRDLERDLLEKNKK